MMQRMGHHSTDGVRAYKRSCQEQQALVSKVLNGEGNSQDCHSTTAPCDSTSGDNSRPNTGKWRPLMPPSAFVVARKECNLGEASKESTSYDKEKCTAHDREKKENDPLQSPSTSLRMFSPPIQLTGCSGVTINYNFRLGQLHFSVSSHDLTVHFCILLFHFVLMN